MHWGSLQDPEMMTANPRIAISFVCSNPTFEKPCIDPKHFDQDKLPPLRIWPLLVCAQPLIHCQRFDLSKDCLRACHEHCEDMENELEASHRQKVFVHFVKAMKEGADGDLDDDEADAVMDEMLVAEQSGCGEFSDDFDDLGGAATPGSGGDHGGDSDSEQDCNDSEEGDPVFGQISACQGEASSEQEPILLFGKRGLQSEEDAPSSKRPKPSS